MAEKVDVRLALKVFELIRTEGEKIDSGYRFKGLTADTDFDGYTASIFNDFVRLDIFFHNKFALNSINKKEEMLFLDKIEQMALTKSP